MPLSEVQRQLWDTSGYVTELVFRTTPRTNKVQSVTRRCAQLHGDRTVCLSQIEIKNLLESLYGINVKAVNTVNFEGKKKRGKAGWYRKPDYKKAFVVLEPPPGAQSTSN